MSEENVVRLCAPTLAGIMILLVARNPNSWVFLAGWFVRNIVKDDISHAVPLSV